MTTDLEIRPANANDASELAANMRAEDLAEMAAGSARDPLEVLVDGLRDSSECWTALYRGRVMAMWGVVPWQGSILGGRVGLGWLLTSPIVDRHPRVFWRACLREFPGLLERWGMLFNFIHCRHMKALRWARRLGLKLEAPVPHGNSEELFVRFSVTKEDLNVRANDNRNRGRDGGGNGSQPLRQETGG